MEDDVYVRTAVYVTFFYRHCVFILRSEFDFRIMAGCYIIYNLIGKQKFN